MNLAFLKDPANFLKNNRVVIGDGAMGTYLQDLELWHEGCPEFLNISAPEEIIKIHQQYTMAGAQWLQTNTFGANPLKLKSFNLENQTVDLNKRGAFLARKAAPHLAIWGDVGPSGKLMQPLGEYSLDQMIEAFYVQVKALSEEGVDGFLIETMGDLAECKAAIMAIRALNKNHKIACTFTFEPGLRTLSGDDAETIASVLQSLNVDILGVNCGFGPAEMPKILEQLAKVSALPILVQPNAGLPRLHEGKTIFPADPHEMARWVLPLVEAGAHFVGGCCGTTPQHIAAMAKAGGNVQTKSITPLNFSSLSGFGQTVYLNDQGPFVIIGERINPTARKKLAENLRNQRYDLVAKEAKEQIEAGASVIDLNVSLPVAEQDEATRLKELTIAVQRLIKNPLSLDTPYPQNMEPALKVMRGKPLLNSTTGDEKTLEIICSLAAKYGSAILGLTLNKKGIPSTWHGRLQIAEYIVKTALAHNINREDIYIDGLTLTAGASQGELPETLKLIKEVKSQLGVKTVLGISNVSHGLPLRPYLTTAYLMMAMAAGLDAAIVNPAQKDLIEFCKAADVLTGRDKNAVSYLKMAAQYDSALEKEEKPISKKTSKEAKTKEVSLSNDPFLSIKEEILLGNKEIIQSKLQELLDQKISPLELVDRCIIAALNEAGELYDRKEYFLPQLLLAAEAAKNGLALLQPLLQERGAEPQGNIVLATVYGDIHDIGKSIVKLMLENHGFNVIDLGKDVEAELIISTAKKDKADLIALSALMTTTMPQMNVVCQKLKKENLDIPVLVGGAIVNDEYAQEIGAIYGADATDAVRLALKLTKNNGRKIE